MGDTSTDGYCLCLTVPCAPDGRGHNACSLTPHSPAQYTADEMKAFDQRAEELMAPKLKQLQVAFSIFDRDGSGLVRVPHLTAYSRVLSGKKDETPYGIGPLDAL